MTPLPVPSPLFNFEFVFDFAIGFALIFVLDSDFAPSLVHIDSEKFCQL